MASRGVSVLILKEDEVLLVRHKQASRHPTDYFGLPGGTLEDKENHEDAAIREVSEETGLEIDKNDLTKIGSYAFTIQRRVGEEETGIILYRCERFAGILKEGTETIPFWAKIGDVLSGKYKFPEISGNFIPDVMKLLESQYEKSEENGKTKK